jgi:hypothetical protein
MDPVKLSEQIVEYFNIDELADLCFRLAIPFEEIPGATLRAKSRELTDYCRRRGKLELLIVTCRELRPHVTWSDVGLTPEKFTTHQGVPAGITPGPMPVASVPQVLGMFWMTYPDTWYGPFNGFYIGWLSMGGFQVWNPYAGIIPYPDPFRQFQRNIWVRLINSPFNVYVDGSPNGYVYGQFSP